MDGCAVKVVIVTAWARNCAAHFQRNPPVTATVADDVATRQLQGLLQHNRTDWARKVSGHSCCLVLWLVIFRGKGW